MPEPVVCEPHKPCVPPKPSPKVECFYDHYSTGQRRYLRGDRRGALEAFHAAEACMPKNPRLLQWIGRCYEELRDRDQAREYYERYLRRRPRADDADYFRSKLESLAHPNGGVPRDGGTR
jgi:tetratricopeptide (TPR) repeat protein